MFKINNFFRDDNENFFKLWVLFRVPSPQPPQGGWQQLKVSRKISSRPHSWAPGLASPTRAGAGYCSGPAIPPRTRDSGRSGTGGSAMPRRLPPAQPCPLPLLQEEWEGGRLPHSPGSNLTTKRQRIKAARRLFLKGRERKWLTAESQSRRSNISSDRNLWEKEPAQGDRA